MELLEHIPAWLLYPAAAGVLFLAWRYLGFRGMLAALGLMVVAFTYRSGRKSGALTEKVKQGAARQEAIETAKEVEIKVDALPIDKAREELKKWSR